MSTGKVEKSPFFSFEPTFTPDPSEDEFGLNATDPESNLNPGLSAAWLEDPVVCAKTVAQPMVSHAIGTIK